MSHRTISALMLGVVLVLAGLAASWAQDMAAPWINEGEAQMGSAVSFTADGGDYRVITSGPTRPAIDATGCTIGLANEKELRVLGGQDANATDRLGVSRVLGFEARAGTTEVTCSDRFIGSSTAGRFQIVSADGPVSIAVIVLFAAGVTLIVVVGLLILRAYLVADRASAA